MRVSIAYIVFVVSLALAAEQPFAINISVEFIGIELLNLDGSPYIGFVTDEIDPGEMVVADSARGIWIHNQSNIPIGLISWAFDDMSFLPEGTPLWEINEHAGKDTCAVGLMIYSSPRNPDIGSVIWQTSTPTPIAIDIPPDVDEYGYICIIPPTDPFLYGEPQHRIRLVFGAYPE